MVLFISSGSSPEELSLWIRRMRLDEGDCVEINISDEFVVECAKSMHRGNHPIVTLGVSADKRMGKAGVAHFALPHPSGRGKTLSPDVITRLLGKCRAYIRCLRSLDITEVESGVEVGVEQD